MAQIKNPNKNKQDVKAKILNNSVDRNKRFESFSNIYTDAQIQLN